MTIPFWKNLFYKFERYGIKGLDILPLLSSWMEIMGNLNFLNYTYFVNLVTGSVSLVGYLQSTMIKVKYTPL